jgi:hypothetical protein
MNTESAIRKRLLVLFAGKAATQHRWPGSENDQRDWHDACQEIQTYLQCPGGLVLIPGDRFLSAEANALVAEAREHCAAIIAHPSVRKAIDLLATAFANAPPDSFGMAQLSGAEIVAICQAEIGDAFKDTNPWSEWYSCPCAD